MSEIPDITIFGGTFHDGAKQVNVVAANEDMLVAALREVAGKGAVEDETVEIVDEAEVVTKTAAPRTNKPTRKQGRPKATDKPFSAYVGEDFDATEVEEQLRGQMKQTMGMADDLRQIQQQMIDSGELKKKIPYKLLLATFGEECVKCNESRYNKSWQ